MFDLVIGLGANLGDPPRVFAQALEELGSAGRITRASRIWRTRPVGPDQPDYSNAAVLLRWPGNPRGLLHRCREIEAAAGRRRDVEERWGPRVLDLDLLLARDLIWRGPELEIPHPRFHERAFALIPAAELVSGWIHPIVGKSIGDLAEEVLAADPDALISSGSTPWWK